MKSVIFVADLFINDYVGGAELTTEALLEASPDTLEVRKLHCQALTQEIADENKDAHWVICNFATLKDDIKTYFCKNMDYSIIEYDYKFCKYRSLEKHTAATKGECDCLTTLSGKINTAFYAYAHKTWFMSDAQREIFLSKIKHIKAEKCETLSSIFSEGDLRFINSIKDNEKDGNYLIIGSDSWIKGVADSIKFAEDNNLEYEVVRGIPYPELLIKMSTSRGLLFHPLGSDTCPRTTIEAKLLGCDLILNDYVQHKDEDWFSTPQRCNEYMLSRPSTFWEHYEQ